MQPIFNKSQINNLPGRLLAWFMKTMRPFPWRKEYAPYQVWISEVMLQQTQAERGAEYYVRWMERFPTIGSVARATEDDILAAWEGLGYYSRARNLHAAARRIMDEHGGVFPSDPERIRALPGVGEYTAGAIAAIAFNLPAPAVDANVLRIVSRLADIDSPVDSPEARRRIGQAVLQIIPPGSARAFNQAVMELGALICRKNPDCEACPVGDFCLARQRGSAGERPVKKTKTAYRIVEMTAGVVIRNGRILIKKRPPRGLWAGLWEFPGGVVQAGEEPERVVQKHVEAATGLAVTAVRPIATVRHGYTTNRVVLHGFVCEAAGSGGDAGTWVEIGEVGGLAFSAGHRKLLERLGWKDAK